MYVSVKNHQILQPMQHQHELNHDHLNPESLSFNSSNNKRLSIMMGGKRITDIKRSLNTMIHKSGARDSMLIADDLNTVSVSKNTQFVPIYSLFTYT